MNIDFAVLADYASVAKDGKLSVAGMFDRLTPPKMPWQHPTMFIAVRIHAHPGEEGGHKIKVRLVDPDGKQIVSLDGEATVLDMDPVEGANVGLVLALNNLPFNGFGRYAFDIFLDNRYEHTVPLLVVAPQTPDSPPSAK